MEGIKLDEDRDDTAEPQLLEDEMEVDEDVEITNPFEVFPHKVWENVVKFLKDNPEDSWNLILANPQLREEVIKKTEILFQKVLPLLFLDLQKKDILACRAVCKYWRNSVDKFLEDHPSTKPYDPEKGFQNETGFRHCSLQDKGMEYMTTIRTSKFPEVIRVIEKAMELGVEPPSFVGKSVAVTHDASDFQTPFLIVDMNAYYNSLLPLLELVGRNISTVSIPMTGISSRMSDVDHYQGLVRCIRSLPNVKSLKIDIPSESVEFAVSPAVRERLYQLLDTHRFPELPNLTSLEVAGWAIDFMPMRQTCRMALRCYHGQIEKLSITPTGSVIHSETELNKVRDLKIIFRDAFESSLEALQSILQSFGTDNVKKLEIDQPKCDLKEVLPMIQHFQRLEVFQLVNCSKDIFPKEGEESLPVLAGVRVLKIRLAELEFGEDESTPNSLQDEGGSNFPSFIGLLKAFPNLEYFEVCLIDANMKIYEEDEVGKKLLECKVIMGDEKEDAKIWDLLPKLKLFVVGDKRFAKAMCFKEKLCA